MYNGDTLSPLLPELVSNIFYPYFHPDDGVVRREQINAITSYIDASNVYGSSLEQQANLRENGGTGGMFIISH